MTQIPEVELKDILLSNTSFGPNEIGVISRKICNDYSQFPNLRDVTAQLESQTERSPATSVRLGVCQYLIGNYEEAIATLENADGGGWYGAFGFLRFPGYDPPNFVFVVCFPVTGSVLF